jgi:hypothetical protein
MSVAGRMKSASGRGEAVYRTSNSYGWYVAQALDKEVMW